jgi:phospholipid/cholesterol/gamma-HCH transport system substrate-binding protein
MDQLKSNEAAATPAKNLVEIPRRSFSVEFLVGVFALISVAAAGYLAIGLGDLKIFGSSRYHINATFENISGLKNGASVEIAGVPVGQVTKISLNEKFKARVELELDKDIKIRDDDILMVRTKGIIGDRYIKISRGASDQYIEPGQTTNETYSVVDIEDIVEKFANSFGADKDKENNKETKK